MLANMNAVSTLEVARGYKKIGIRVIPIVPGTKRPPERFRLKQYRTVKPSEQTFENWFVNEGHDVGILMGSPSGCLAIRDFDNEIGCRLFHEWEAAYPHLAQSLPIVATPGPGMHVLFKYDPDKLPDRFRGNGCYKFPDGSGELRYDNCYCVAPPSRHESGGTYKWINMPNNSIPTLSLEATGFLSDSTVLNKNRTALTTDRTVLTKDDTVLTTNATEICTNATLNTHAVNVQNDAPYDVQNDKTHDTLNNGKSNSENSDKTPENSTFSNLDTRGHTKTQETPGKPIGKPKNPEAIVAVRFSVTKNANAQATNYTKETLHDINTAILDSQPTGAGKRHRQVFELARTLKAIPELKDEPAKALKPYVKEWHKLALPNITTKSFQETWIDFLNGWKRVRFPKGADTMKEVFERAVNAEVPAEAEQYDDHPKLQLLVALCRELQLMHQDSPFFLSTRVSGRFLEATHQDTSRWLFLLEHDGIIQRLEKGSMKTGKASSFRYVSLSKPKG